MTDENLIVFPRGYRERPPGTLQEIREAVDELALFHVEESLGPMMGMIFEALLRAGFDFTDRHEETQKDVAMVLTALKSLMCKVRYIKHPFQKTAEETFDDLGDGNLVFRGTDKSPIPEHSHFAAEGDFE
jgi:hypothetical protein